MTTSLENKDDLVVGVIGTGYRDGHSVRESHRSVGCTFDMDCFASVVNVGHIKGDPDLLVTIMLQHGTLRRSDSKELPIVFWSACGRYADYEMCMDWLKAKFKNCKHFVNSQNIHQIQE